MKVICLISLLLTFSLSASSFQQEATRQSDRIYISLDKPYHAAGEHIGFSVYLLDRISHQLKESPRIVYLELFHPKGNRLLSQVIRTEKGLGKGRLLLPDSLSGAVYLLTAYTQSMAQEEEPAIAWKQIFVDGEQALKKYVTDKGNAPQLSFYPEGGRLVERLNNQVGVHLLDAGSNAIAAEGELLNNKREVVGTFSTSESGTGSFVFTPEPGLSYYGRLKFKGRTIEARLPHAQAEGLLLKVDDTNPDSLRIAVAATPSLYGEKFQLRILSRGVTILQTSGQARHYDYRIKVPVASLLPGLGYVQLLSEKGDLLATRPVYLDEQQKPEISLHTPKDHYPVRTEVALRVQLKDEAGRPLNGNFTVSVFNKKYAMPKALDENIRHRMFVAAEAKTAGVTSVLPSSWQQNGAKEMDNWLLMTLADTSSLYRPTKKIGYLNVLEGRLLLKGTARPLADTTLMVSIVRPEQSAPVLLFARTDADGCFSITLPAESGSNAVYLKVKDADDWQDMIDYQVELWEDAPALTNRKQLNSRFDMQQTAGYYRVFKENKLIDQAYSTSPVSVLEEDSNKLDGHAFQGFDAVYNMNDFQQVQTFRDMIIDIIPHVRVRKSKGHYRLLIDSRGKKPGKLPGEPLFLLDGVPVNNPDIMFALSPAEIERVEVAHASLFFDGFPVHGIFSVTTKSKEIYQRTDVHHYRYTSVGAPFPVRYEFREYSPSKVSETRLPDFRPLLFYRPMAATDEKGELDLHFYTADEVGTFRIFVEGVTEDGRLFSAFKDIEVEGPVR